MSAELDQRIERMVLREHRNRRARLVNVLAACVVVAAALAGMGLARTVTAAPAVPSRVPTGVTADKTGFAVATGPVRVDIYIDYLCPECRITEKAIAPVIGRLEAARAIDLVYHPIGFLDSYSDPPGYSSRAAAAAACAADAGRLARYTAVLYNEQPRERGPGLSEAALIAAGGKAGITGPAFPACVRGGRYTDWVSYASDTAYANNIAITPTVLVNGRHVDLTGPGPGATLARAVAAAKRTGQRGNA